MLPLTQRRDVPTFYGTRHRAAMGLAERCDALVVAVSEERAEVTLMGAGSIRHMADAAQFAAILEGLLSPARETMGARLHRFFFANLGLKFAALGLAGMFWWTSFLASGTTIRTLSVPIEFSNVPSGMEVAGQSADTLDVQVRGSPWIMDSVSLGKLVGGFDLGGLHPGWYSLRLQPRSLDLPPGIAVDRVTPETIRVQVVAIANAASTREVKRRKYRVNACISRKIVSDIVTICCNPARSPCIKESEASNNSITRG